MENRQNNKKSAKPVNVRALKSGSYSLVLCVLAIVLVVAVNLLAGVLPTSFTKLDASSVDMLTLGDESRQVADEVDTPVTMYLIAPRGGEDITILSLLERYADLNPKITVKTVDPDTTPGFVSQFTENSLNMNSVIVDGEYRDYVIDYLEIYVTDYSNVTEEEMMNYYYYGIEPSGVPYFYGELMVSSALRFVSAEKIPTVYALTNHGEDALTENMRAYFTTDNVVLKEFSFLTSETVPEDCSVILLNNPKADISQYEAERLTAYLKEGGNVMLVTDYSFYSAKEMPNIASVTALMGMRSEDGLLVEGNSSNYYPNYPYFLIPVPGTTGPAAEFGGAVNALLPYAHGIILTGEGNAKASALLSTTTASYVKKGEMTENSSILKEDGDAEGSFSVAAYSVLQAEKGESRMVWFACPYIVNDEMDYYINGGNSAFFMASVNWMSDENISLSILAKQLQVESLVIPAGAATLWSTVFTLALPALILIGGFVIWFRRRRK